MDIKAKIETVATTKNSGGQCYLAFPYTSAIGDKTEQLNVQVPIVHEQPSEADRRALFDAVNIQGGLGKWIEQPDGAIWLWPN